MIIIITDNDRDGSQARRIKSKGPASRFLINKFLIRLATCIFIIIVIIIIILNGRVYSLKVGVSCFVIQARAQRRGHVLIREITRLLV